MEVVVLKFWVFAPKPKQDVELWLQNQFLCLVIVICHVWCFTVLGNRFWISGCLFLSLWDVPTANNKPLCYSHIYKKMCFRACTYIKNIMIYYDILWCIMYLYHVFIFCIYCILCRIFILYLYIHLKRTVYRVLAYLPSFHVFVILFGLFYILLQRVIGIHHSDQTRSTCFQTITFCAWLHHGKPPFRGWFVGPGWLSWCGRHLQVDFPSKKWWRSGIWQKIIANYS